MAQHTPGRRVTAKALRERYGNISDMTLWRWEHDENLGFPKPIVVNRRKYFDLDEIEAWERQRAPASLQQTVTPEALNAELLTALTVLLVHVDLRCGGKCEGTSALAQAANAARSVIAKAESR